MSTIDAFSSEFEQLHSNLTGVLDLIPDDQLYRKPFESAAFVRIYSCGELIGHIGGIIEYAFNGITSNFWEEPFEWITREALPTASHIRKYLDDVARVRRLAFESLRDADLPKQVFYPNAAATTIGAILVETLAHASHHRGQVYAYVHLFTGARLPAIAVRARTGT
ncbi:MAG TPA: DinB family protein [Blastocatellia bacterium]|nr:DinB family protein [Blastocatellia bacterium]